MKGESAKLANIRESWSVREEVSQVLQEKSWWQALLHLRALDPYLFEEVVLTGFEAKGYLVKRGRRYSKDNGVDGSVFVDGAWYYVQSKRYFGHISAKHITRFAKKCKSDGVGGYFAHTGKTPQNMRYFLKQNPHVRVLSGEKLVTHIAGQSDMKKAGFRPESAEINAGIENVRPFPASFN